MPESINNKLTMALKGSFILPTARTVIIATVSPSSKDTEHSLNTLKHACIMDVTEGAKQRAAAGVARWRPRMSYVWKKRVIDWNAHLGRKLNQNSWAAKTLHFHGKQWQQEQYQRTRRRCMSCAPQCFYPTLLMSPQSPDTAIKQRNTESR